MDRFPDICINRFELASEGVKSNRIESNRKSSYGNRLYIDRDLDPDLYPFKLVLECAILAFR
ncbi:MAG: hypothetical protein H6677_15710 [Candidatus Obscuribacterales bacterium]|nr:hypothetical protein [Candidatus Obscuribacterales bacterium]